MQHLSGLRQIADRYDGFIVDLWGVVHDGVAALPGAHDCLTRMRAAGKRIVLLSNAPRRAALAEEGLRAMGLPNSLYDRLLTSGEATHDLLAERTDPFFAGLGQRVYHLGPARDRGVLDGAGCERVERVEDAAFVLNTGPDDERPEAIEQFTPVLRAASALGLPMVCANPDLDVIRGGQRVICAGRLALAYEDLGGMVRRIGKPDPAIYDPAVATLGCERTRIAALGDALATDILGATRAGIDSIWVLGGIHAALRGHEADAETEAVGAGLAPVATLPGLVW